MNDYDELKLKIYESSLNWCEKKSIINIMESFNKDEDLNEIYDVIESGLTIGNNGDVHPVTNNFARNVYSAVEKCLPKDFETCNIECDFNNGSVTISSIHYNTKNKENIDLFDNRGCSKYNFIQKHNNKIFVRSILNLSILIAREKFFKDIQCKTAIIKIDKSGHFTMNIGYGD